MNRKQVIILTIVIVLSAIFIVVASILIAAAVYGKTFKVHTSKELDGVDIDICDIMYYASLAANSHNTQLWKVNIYPKIENNKSKIEILYDEKRVLNIVDGDKREAYLTLGHYIELLIMLLNVYGYNTTISYSNNNYKYSNYDIINLPVATLYFTKDKSKEIYAKSIENLINLIKARHSDKRKYKKDVILSEHYDSLKNIFGESINIYSIGDSKFNYIRDNSINAVKSQSSDQNYRDELAEWLRFSNKESNEKLDGINADMMGFSGLKKGFYYMTIHRKNAKGKKFANQGISTAKSQVENCGSFIVITGNINVTSNDVISGTIEIGRLSQRIWLECTKYGISLQPFSAILEVEPYKSQIQNDLQLNNPVQMIFRAGYIKKYGNNIKLRRNLKDYIEVINQ